MGTLIRDFETHDLLADLVHEGDRFCAARGGQGGRGNARFLTAANRAPRFAEKGQPGEEREFLLEVKLIAEVGFVGLPNAGKSTLLAAISAAQPKIADYPFTTLSPNLGIATLSGYRTLTVADIPGIIEGAADGKGLGHDFLRHIERTKVLLFVIDLGDPDPVATKNVLENELKQYSAVFAKRPRVYALNKSDIPENAERFKKLRRRFKDCFMISAATGEGVPELIERLWSIVEPLRHEPEPVQEPVLEREYRYEAPFTVEKTGHGFRVEGRKIVRAVQMTDFENTEAVKFLHRRLKRMGLFKALERLGAMAGDAIEIGETELEYHPD